MHGALRLRKQLNITTSMLYVIIGEPHTNEKIAGYGARASLCSARVNDHYRSMYWHIQLVKIVNVYAAIDQWQT